MKCLYVFFWLFVRRGYKEIYNIFYVFFNMKGGY